VAGSPRARLTGLLERDSQGSWAAGPNGSPGSSVSPQLFQPSLREVLAQPPESFPAFNTPSKLAAERYIFGNLFPNVPFDPTYGIRALYWENPDIDWGDLANKMNKLAPCTDFPCGGAYQEVENQLSTEFSDVDAVRGYFATLKSILNTTFGQDSIAFTGISQEILGLYDVQAAPQGPDPIAILTNVLSFASGATAAVPGAEVASGGFAIAAGISGLIDQLANNGDGSSALDPSTFQTDMEGWGQSLITGWNTGIASLDQIAGLLVSDWGRLQAAVNDINTPICPISCGSPGSGPDPNSWDLGNEAQLTTALDQSATQYMWQTMLPAAVDVANWNCWASFNTITVQLVPPAGVPTTAMFKPNWVTQGSSGPKVTGAELFPVGPDESVPPSSLLDSLFSQPTLTQPNNLGFEPQYFWAGAWMNGSKAVTPGFVYASPLTNQLVREAFAPDLPPPGLCLPPPS
jgi:hypothetical protein